MTRYTVDAATLLRIIREDVPISAEQGLVGPAAIRSEVLSLLYAAVRAGEFDERAARDQLEKLARVKIRLLGDRVSRSVAWKLANQLGLSDTAPAEYLAVATLQSDALIAGDPALRAAAKGLVPIARFEDLSP